MSTFRQEPKGDVIVIRPLVRRGGLIDRKRASFLYLREPRLNMDKREQALDLFQQAYERQMKGDLETAIFLYKRSIAVSPTAEAHTFLGWAYSFQGRYRDAIRECKRAIEADPDLGNPYNDIGVYLTEEGRYDEAIGYLRRALLAKRYEALHYPHYNLGRAFEKKGWWREAITEYQEALRINSEYPLAERSLAKLRALLN
jgi:tetratricopeptide (TPR) repeat protein